MATPASDTSLKKDVYSVLHPPQTSRSGIMEVKLSHVIGLYLPCPSNGWHFYVTLKYQESSVSVETMLWDSKCEITDRWPGQGPGRLFLKNGVKFDVPSPSGDLAVYIMAARDHQSQPREQPTMLAFMTLDPSAPPSGWVSLRDNAGRLRVETSFVEKQVSGLEDSKAWTIGPQVSYGNLARVIHKETSQAYAMSRESGDSAAVQLSGSDADNATPQGTHVDNIAHPFLVPCKYVFESQDKSLRLLSPIATNGHLFYYQAKRRLSVEESTFYIAELVSVVEYVHNLGKIVLLQMEIVLVDALGHISLCSPGIFTTSTQQRTTISNGEVNPHLYWSPEELQSYGAYHSPASDWWALGALLYELLVGVPPFFTENAKEYAKAVTNDTITLPKWLTTESKDLLTALLEKSPEKRPGPSDIKAHPFFRDIDWEQLPMRPCTGPIQSGKNVSTFMSDAEKQIVGLRDPRWNWDISPFIDDMNAAHDAREEAAKVEDNRISTQFSNDTWDLAVDDASQDLYFRNRITGEEKRCTNLSERNLKTSPEHTAAGIAPPERPSQLQLKRALVTALKSGLCARVVLQILDLGADLNSTLLDHEYESRSGEGAAIQWTLFSEVISPLEWAVEKRNIDLARVFVDRGALVSPPAQAAWDRRSEHHDALMRAVKNGDEAMTVLLVGLTAKRDAIRALARAIELQDVNIVGALLSHGVSAVLRGAGLRLYTTQPLVRAARLGSVEIVRLLLENGADPNVGYHLLRGWGDDGKGTGDNAISSVEFTCGTALLIAMENGHDEVVRLLLDHGASPAFCLPPCRDDDVDDDDDAEAKRIRNGRGSFAPCVDYSPHEFPSHSCRMVSREVYIRVVARIEAMASTIGE
ncbi:hypothetical protein F4824DRAFT_515834 [Ustulina deusta]|nr:hypothetical protein F4824DRAFT_515834 [Ustulina deusta]